MDASPVMRTRLNLRMTAGLVLALDLLVSPATALSSDWSLHVAKTRFVVTGNNGTTLPDDKLIGAKLPIGDPNNGGYVARINAISQIPSPREEGFTAYNISFRNPSTGQWEPLCQPGPQGLALAIPIPGRWTADGHYHPLLSGQFTLTCTAGAHVKCLRMGYSPWAMTPRGDSMAPYHQACTRMMRADYCGHGIPFTVSGKRIQVIDTTGRHEPPRKRYGAFEAVWGVKGAICVRRPRVPALFSLETILQKCPGLRQHTGEACSEAVLQHHSEALLANWSFQERFGK